jgi:hypothetical protein
LPRRLARLIRPRATHVFEAGITNHATGLRATNV